MQKNSSKILAALGLFGCAALVSYEASEWWGKPKHHCSSITAEFYHHRRLRVDQEGPGESLSAHSWANRSDSEPAAPANDSLLPSEVDGVLQKTAFSSKMRMVFLVGLEGTGHHFMNHILDRMCHMDEVVCPDTCSLANAVYYHLGTPETAHDYRMGLQTLRDEAQALALGNGGSLDPQAVSLVSLGKCSDDVGQLSFPNFRGQDKPLQYVDIRVLAEEAERAGIDLRLIYMSRLAETILLSDTQNRDFGEGFAHEARILINNAAVIDSSLRELHPSFVTCFSYEMSCDADQASRLGDFVAPTDAVAAQFAKVLIESVAVQPPAVREDVDDPEGWDLMTNRLQKKLDDIDRAWC